MLSWRTIKRPFDPKKQGHCVLLLGPAKMGKTTVLSHLYKSFAPERIFWMSGGELDGWRVVTKTAGVEPEGIDLDELKSLGAFWQLLESLRDGWHHVVVLDSFDGAARWAERHICRADTSRRRDKKTGIDKLDMRGYGLKLNWTVATVRDYLYPITLAGTHVIVTCGLKAMDLNGDSLLVPDIEGQSALIVPRFFGDVALLQKTRKGRSLCFSGVETLSIHGSRSGFPDLVPSEDFGALLLKTHHSRVFEGKEFVESKAASAHDKPWWEHRFPELCESYRLEAGDIEAEESGCVGMGLEQADSWQDRVVDRARLMKERGRLNELDKRNLALVCWAYRLQEAREESFL